MGCSQIGSIIIATERRDEVHLFIQYIFIKCTICLALLLMALMRTRLLFKRRSITHPPPPGVLKLFEPYTPGEAKGSLLR